MTEKELTMEQLEETVSDDFISSNFIVILTGLYLGQAAAFLSI